MNEHVYKPALGQIAYEAYRRESGGMSLATGDLIPLWAGLPANIRAAWDAGAQAVAAYLDRVPR